MRRYMVLGLGALALWLAGPGGWRLANSETLSITSLRRSIDSPGARPIPGPRVPIAHPAPIARRALPNYTDPARYAQLVPKPEASPITGRVVAPIDPASPPWTTAPRTRRLPRARTTSLPTASTGLWPWWSYQSRSIPGVGVALVNVANLNLLLFASDVEVPEGALDLAFHRVYNSQSQHDENNDDGSTPSVYGNRWTNNLDVHLGWVSTGQNTGIVSVYTAEGARDDFACEVDIAATCTPQTSGIHDFLVSVNVTSGVACQFQWTRKSGSSYMFNAPYAACGNGSGSFGRLTRIYGRNQSFYLNLSYSWSPNDSDPENLSQLTVTHKPDGAQLILGFGRITGTNITELLTLTRPDGLTVNYHYAANGDLIGVDKPGNNPVLVNGVTLPNHFADGSPIVQGNLPEIYDLTQSTLLEACGPRAAITILNGDSTKSTADGACVDFDYNGSQLADWWTRGVLNPTPGDNVSPSPIQTGPPTGFVQWDDAATFTPTTVCNPYSGLRLQDAFSHNVLWCYDSVGRLTETSIAVSASDTLTSSQTWDSNNNLTSITDARANTTNIAYDSNGNVVEVSLPSQSTSIGTIRPTYLYDYDSNGHNDLKRYCDPANNSANSWNPSPGPTPCTATGDTNYASFQYDTGDVNEPYGCLTDSYTPGGYHRTLSYGVDCGTGQPTQIQGHAYMESDGTNRTPTETFTYFSDGTVKTHGNGVPDGAVTQLTYTANGMKRIRSAQDPDGVVSYRCYNLNGSLFYSESASQYLYDEANCPNTAQMLAGATPPPFATAYGYDADGDVATVTQHHDCLDYNSSCAANNPATTKCNGITLSSGTGCYYYDGLDRVVEIKQTYDTTFDLYSNPWITRYLYDLTGLQQSFHDQSFLAYGNLFEIEELLPQQAASQITAPASAGSVINGSYKPLKGTAYDALDRPVALYSAMGTGTDYTTESLTWDSGPIGANIAGLLGKDCNSATPQQCKEFNYTARGELKTFQAIGSPSPAPERDYTYDPDGRTTQIVSAAYQYPQTYAYDVNGDVRTSIDASNDLPGRATLTYNRYPDGLEQSLDVSDAVLNQVGLFTYSYRNDGPLQTELIDDTSLGSTIYNAGKTKVRYDYTDAGRVLSRGETGAAAHPSPTPQTIITYQNTLGLLKTVTTLNTTLSQVTFTLENELTGITDANCLSRIEYFYALRGELAGSRQCSSSGGGEQANGLSLHGAGSPFASGTQLTWNNLMAVLTNVSPSGSSAVPSYWTYDQAGRMISQGAPYPQFSPSPAPVVATRTYDAENHVTLTTRQSGTQGTWPSESINWGPDGHPFAIGVSPNGQTPNNERLHWDGNRLLFTTHLKNGTASLDDIKVGVEGDILPGDSGYAGLTFYDRGPGGAILGCHNVTGTSYAGFGDSFGVWNSSPCALNLSPTTATMPTSLVWTGSPYSQALTVGNGGTLAMPRPDGFTDGLDTIQGDRAYDNTSGLWTTPDQDQGNLYNPASQKNYIWNDNNPLAYADPSGNDALYIGSDRAYGPGYHEYGVLTDDDNNVIAVFSFGPSAGPFNSFLNNNYNPGAYYFMATSQNGANLFQEASCYGTCSWEPGLLRSYRTWRNNWIPYIFISFNSNWALSRVFAENGIPLSLPPGHPWLPGWGPDLGVGTCVHFEAQNFACHHYPGSLASNGAALVRSLGLDDIMYTIYGGDMPNAALVCNFDITCITRL